MWIHLAVALLYLGLAVVHCLAWWGQL
jgi:hypothetical protein